jgi:uncharacterized alkaline shock family protein YloU
MIAHGLRPTARTPPDPAGDREEDVARVPTDPTPGRSLVTRRAIVDVIRAATLGSYGVTGFAATLPERALAALGMGHPGIRVRLEDAPAVDLDITVAFGLPVAEVARQVDSAVRYGIRRSLGREVGRLTIHVDGLRYQPGGPPPASAPHGEQAVGPAELAESGTDVAG